MNSVSKMALGAALTLGLSSVLSIAPAAAQTQSPLASVSLTKAERDALASVDTALRSGNFAAASAALAAARSVATGADARHYLNQYQYQIAVARNDHRAQAEAIETLIAGGRIPAAHMPALYGQLGSIAYSYIGDYKRAEAAFTAQVEAAPTSPQALTNLARVKRDLKKPQEALSLLTRAIAAQRAAGQAVPESWYKMGLDLAYSANAGAPAAALGREFVATYPTKQNWRDALLIQRQLQGADPVANLDAYRLLRASKGLSGERDYLEMAAALNAAGFPGEAKEVIQEGVALRMVDAGGRAKDYLTGANTRIAKEKASLAGLQSRAMADATGALALKTADTLLGYGDYAKAIPLYQAALQKGSVDTNLVNSHLGMALALAGQRAEAEAALRAVTGPRADLAGYWLAWLAQSS